MTKRHVNYKGIPTWIFKAWPNSVYKNVPLWDIEICYESISTQSYSSE